ncbi:MAG: hypothetical protein Q9160_008303 [Pyrenula sp. 1 TL-2023]
MESSPWVAPSNEKIGEMNLHWPHQVRYKGNSDQHTKQKKDMNMKATSLSSSTLCSDISPIYEKRLSTDEIRFLCLTKVDDVNLPIHMTLDVFPNDACPEYEAVSYAWGGEDGDNTSCHPVYVGDFWDILLQTKNCWTMLRYMRTRISIPSVWVDAICINQRDMTERDAQAAKMGTIYQRCMRVVVYLGDSIVYSNSSNRPSHPRRYNLHDFDDVIPSSVIDLKGLLELRYFSRVWVVQELLLAPSVVIPVNDRELFGGSLTATRLRNSRPSWKWNSTNAPWARELSSGRYFPPADLFEMLRLTQNSRATDSRDRVFGILGLIGDDITHLKLKPDYSISSVHTFIGTFAHILINHQQITVLTNAAGDRAPSHFPTWLPDFDSPFDLTELQERIQHRSLEDHKDSLSHVKFLEVPFHRLIDLYTTDFFSMTSEPLWYSDASVCSRSGALEINLFHLLKISSRPTKVGTSSPTEHKVSWVNPGVRLYEPLSLYPARKDPARKDVLSVKHSLYDMIGGIVLAIEESTREKFNSKPLLEHSEFTGLETLFLGRDYSLKDLLPVFQGALNEKSDRKPGFLDSHLQFHQKWRPRCSPRVDYAKRFRMTIPPEEWGGGIKSAASFRHPGWRWRLKPQTAVSHVHPWKHCNEKFRKRKFSQPIEVAIDTGMLTSIKNLDVLIFPLSFLSRWVEVTGEEETALFIRGPKYEDHFVHIWEWPKVLKVEQKMRRVNIL